MMVHILVGAIIGALAFALIVYAPRPAVALPPAAGWSHGHNYVELARLIMRQTVEAIQGIEQRGALGTITVIRPDPLPDSPGWYRVVIDVQFYCEPAPDAMADSATA